MCFMTAIPDIYLHSGLLFPECGAGAHGSFLNGISPDDFVIGVMVSGIVGVGKGFRDCVASAVKEMSGLEVRGE